MANDSETARRDGGEDLRSLGERIWVEAMKAKEQRALDMPDDYAALVALSRAHQRLGDLGWRDAIYCPKDGTLFEVIEAGSTGIHDCVYHGEWPKGDWWIIDAGDLCPSRPILFRLKPAAPHATGRETGVKESDRG